MKCSIATEGTALSKISESIGEGNQNFFYYVTKGNMKQKEQKEKTFIQR